MPTTAFLTRSYLLAYGLKAVPGELLPPLRIPTSNHPVCRSPASCRAEMAAASWTGLSRTRAFGSTHRDTVTFDDEDGLKLIKGLRHVELRRVEVKITCLPLHTGGGHRHDGLISM